MNPFKKEALTTITAADARLPRVLRARDLIALGIGAVIGTGIFILPGHEAATHAGPAVSIAFLIAAIVSGLAGMAYAEFASAMPVAGSAYSFGSVIFGEIIGWLLGWALILEYFLAAAAVATGFAAYFNNNILTAIGITMPQALSAGPMEGGVINLTAVVIILIVALIVGRGLNLSRRVENVAVVFKVAIIILFIIVGLFFIKAQNYTPFYPKAFQGGAFGLSGIMQAAATVVFAFLGFDILAAHSAEVIEPQKNMKRGLLGTVIVAAILYVVFALVLTGIAPYSKLGVDDPAAYVLNLIGHGGWAKIITIGALVGMFTSIMAATIASSRLLYSIGRDGLLPKALGETDERGLPTKALIVAAVIAAIFAGLVPLTQLAALINAGTLLAFIAVSFGILPLRKRKDIPNTGFKMPLYPILPAFTGLLNVYFLLMLPAQTKISVVIWMVVGVVVYFLYGIRHSKLQAK